MHLLFHSDYALSPPDHVSRGGDAYTNLQPKTRSLFEAAIAEHPEFNLFVADEPMGSNPGYLSLRIKGERPRDLSSFWATFWRLKTEMNINF